VDVNELNPKRYRYSKVKLNAVKL